MCIIQLLCTTPQTNLCNQNTQEKLLDPRTHSHDNVTRIQHDLVGGGALPPLVVVVVLIKY